MSAGRRDMLITLQAFTAVQDEYGGETQTWADLGQEWAQVFWGRGDERRAAAVEYGTQAATFNVLSNEITRTLTIKDRILLDGDEWDITSIAPVGRGEIEATAVRKV